MRPGLSTQLLHDVRPAGPRQPGLLIPLPALSLWLCSQCSINRGQEQSAIPEPALAGANRSLPVHLPAFPLLSVPLP